MKKNCDFIYNNNVKFVLTIMRVSHNNKGGVYMFIISALSLICALVFGRLVFFEKQVNKPKKLEKPMKDMLFKLIFCISVLVFLIILPFIIEQIILYETIFPFNFAITFSREIWFGFVASYIGAIGTVALGGLALWQNKRYKKLSDTSSEKMAEALETIKETIWRNNIPILVFEPKKIIQVNFKKPVNTLEHFWKNSIADGNLYLKFIDSKKHEKSKDLQLTKTYSFQLANLSDFPIQQISPVKLTIRDNKNFPRRFEVTADGIQGYVDGNSSINCNLEIYNIPDNDLQFNDKILEISLTLRITDSKGYSHDKYFQIASGSNPVKSDDAVIWDTVYIISTKIYDNK